MGSRSKAPLVGFLIFVVFTINALAIVSIPFSEEGASCGAPIAAAFDDPPSFDTATDPLFARARELAVACQRTGRIRLTIAAIALGVGLAASALVLRRRVQPDR